MKQWWSHNWRRFTVIGIPSLWFILFLFLPFLVVLKISLAEPIIASPPFTDLVYISKQTIHIVLSYANYLFIFTHSGFFVALWESIKIALITTILCAVVGYPMTYAIANSRPSIRPVLFMLVILPYWTSFLLRAYAWVTILQNNGLINHALMWLHITDQPIRMIYTNFSVYVGLLYGYLPYFILPLYASLLKLDRAYLEAASDLGCKPWKSFIKITLPLTWPGVMAGCLLVFIPAIGEVVIPQVLGGLNTMMIGNIVWEEFFVANNWCIAAALAVVMLIVLLLPIIWLQRIQRKAEAKS